MAWDDKDLTPSEGLSEIAALLAGGIPRLDARRVTCLEQGEEESPGVSPEKAPRGLAVCPSSSPDASGP